MGETGKLNLISKEETCRPEKKKIELKFPANESTAENMRSAISLVYASLKDGTTFPMNGNCFNISGLKSCLGPNGTKQRKRCWQ